MTISAKRMAVLHEHIRAESAHDIDALIGGMTPDCFNVSGVMTARFEELRIAR
jgi:hypothetical protein